MLFSYLLNGQTAFVAFAVLFEAVCCYFLSYCVLAIMRIVKLITGSWRDIQLVI